MNNKKIIIGHNIEYLRKAFGETQEELGYILNLQKNAISNYEHGIREPNKDILIKIAKHFVVSVEDLLSNDFSNIGSIAVDNTVFWRNIDSILPAVSSEETMNNDNFKKAYKHHTDLYKRLKELNMDYFKFIDICLEEYEKAYEDDKIKAETAANILALSFLYIGMSKIPELINNKSAFLMQLAERDIKVRDLLDNIDQNFEKEIQELSIEFNNPKVLEDVNELITTLKRSEKYVDLAEYYIALQYKYNIVGNKMEIGFNQRVGEEMMCAFALVGNPYAARYLKFSLDFIGQSSQTVDDNNFT